jgi:hypothetical protein
MLARMWGERNLHILLVGMCICTTIIKNSREAPQKTKDRTSIGSIINTTPRKKPKGICPVKIKSPAYPNILQHYSQ